MPGHRRVILVGDITDHGGTVLSSMAPKLRYDGRSIATVHSWVSCPMHGTNKIVGSSGIQGDGWPLAVEGMVTECGSHLIASQTMFNTTESKQGSDGRYQQPLWDQVSPGQPLYNPYGATPLPGDPPLSPVPPDNVAPWPWSWPIPFPPD